MRFVRPIFVVILFCLIQQKSFPQSKYWVFFKDKSICHNISNELDLPVNEVYVQQLRQKQITILERSRWFNAVSVVLFPNQLTDIQQLSFVKSIEPLNDHFKILSLSESQQKPRGLLAPVMEQVQADEFRKLGLTGKGVKIGVIDAGYYEAPKNASLVHLFDRKAIIDKRDYVNPERLSKFFSSTESQVDTHGTEVLSYIAGNDTVQNLQLGLATDATFYLTRTDHGAHEWRGEEDNWIAAIEWLDSLGVKLVNSSLGYANGFSNPTENYKPSQMNGQTSLISRAAQIATQQKGMLIVVSAGNEGDDQNWQVISTPADAEGVLTVGATYQKTWHKTGYSSIGPDFLSYLKPNVSCYSLMGTSLSAPVVTGFAACLMQANPELTGKQVREIIEKSAHLYPHGNNFVGYGVPQAAKALALLLNTPSSTQLPSRQMQVAGDIAGVLLNHEPNAPAVIYHKKDRHTVVSQELVTVQDRRLTLKRQPNETHTTIDCKQEVVEVIWK